MQRNMWTRRGSRGWEEGRRSHGGPAGAFILWGYPALKRRTSGQHKDHGTRVTASAKRVSQGTSSRIVLGDTSPSPRMCPNRAAKFDKQGSVLHVPRCGPDPLSLLTSSLCCSKHAMTNTSIHPFLLPGPQDFYFGNGNCQDFSVNREEMQHLMEGVLFSFTALILLYYVKLKQ